MVTWIIVYYLALFLGLKKLISFLSSIVESDLAPDPHNYHELHASTTGAVALINVVFSGRIVPEIESKLVSRMRSFAIQQKAKLLIFVYEGARAIIKSISDRSFYNPAMHLPTWREEALRLTTGGYAVPASPGSFFAIAVRKHTQGNVFSRVDLHDPNRLIAEDGYGKYFIGIEPWMEKLPGPLFFSAVDHEFLHLIQDQVFSLLEDEAMGEVSRIDYFLHETPVHIIASPFWLLLGLTIFCWPIVFYLIYS